MKWSGRRSSENFEDRRGMSSGGKTIVGGGIIGIIILLLNVFGGENAQMLTPILEQFNQGQSAPTEQRDLTAAEIEEGKFIEAILVDTEDVWGKIFQENNMQYERPKLMLFTDAVETGCGSATSASGPFYCPADRKVYIDLSFYQEMKNRFNAPGDFAQAYVIAHEVGHHIQNLMGTSEQVQRARQSARSEAEANEYSVRLELQADCFAGVWANHADGENRILEAGDVEEAMTAAAAIGDDALQKEAQGYAVPDSFTHGSSEQRMRWFNQGLSTGDVNQCNTFETKVL